MREGKAGFHKDQGITGFRQTKYKKDKVNAPAKLSINTCPQCNSKRLWKDGLRHPRSNGKPIQRYICRECGYRFSETSQYNCLNGSEHSKYDQKVHRLILKTPEDYLYSCQVGDRRQSGAKNLVEVQSRIEKRAAGAIKPVETSSADVKGKIVEYLWHLKKQGYAESTVKMWVRLLKQLVKEGANLFDPESVKQTIATHENWSDGYKRCMVYTYESFLEMLGMHWTRPKYVQASKLPFVPLEREIDALIAGCSKKLAALLQVLKETGMRIGEACRLNWTDVDVETNTIRCQSEKHGNPRIFKVSAKLIAMLNALPKTNRRIFYGTINGYRHRFTRQKRRLARKLQNPRLEQIKFHTFRHWKATMEYHRTKDIIYVKQLLGHKSINNTMLYTQLVQFESDEFHSAVAKTIQEARELIEAGFEYVCDMESVKLFRKRK